MGEMKFEGMVEATANINQVYKTEIDKGIAGLKAEPIKQAKFEILGVSLEEKLKTAQSVRVTLSQLAKANAAVYGGYTLSIDKTDVSHAYAYLKPRVKNNKKQAAKKKAKSEKINDVNNSGNVQK